MKLYVTLDGEGGGKTHAIGELLGPFGVVALEGGDALTLSARGAQVPLTIGDQGALVGDAPVDDGDFVFDLVRPSDRSAHVVVSPPPSFTVTLAASTAGQFPIRWTAASGDFTTALQLTGDCIRGFSTQLGSDTGSYDVDLRALDATGGCTLTARITRHASGSIVLFGETWAFFDATQSRTATLAWSGP